MKKLIAVVFTVSMLVVSAANAETTPAQSAAGQTHNQTAQASSVAGVQPIGKTFADTVNGFKPTVPTCIPTQGAQGFSGGSSSYGY